MEKNKKILPAYLDEKVILTMVVISLIALIITGFKYKNHEYCFPFQIKASAVHYYTDEPVKFEANVAGASNFEWDFGDNESNETSINSVIHAYDQPGEYNVTLTVNGKCSEYKTVYISRAPKVENPLLLPTFVCPQTAEVGQPVVFRDTTTGARSWEWRFGETASIDATASTASYVYKTPGLKTISLVINNNLQQTAICKVFVNDVAPKSNNNKPRNNNNRQAPIMIVQAKPNTPTLAEQVQPAVTEPAKPKGTSISKAELEDKLRKVINNFAGPQDFNDYFCNNLQIPVSLNGEEITFTQLCTKLSSIKSEKKIKELQVQQIKSSETNCIVSLNVNLKMKKGFLGIFK